jgi:PAS domain S-box-containing protein
VAVFQNITDRKQVEKNLENANIAARNVLEDLQLEKEALAHAKAKDEALLESIGEGLIAVDNDRKILVINKVAERMLGWNGRELIGKELTDLPLEDEAGNLIPLDKRPTTIALATGEVTKVTYFFVRKNGTRFPMATTATPIKLGGKTIGLIEIVRDITHEKEVDKAKDEFISLASHQLRSPLTTISWYTEMILNGDVGEVAPDQKKYLEEIYQGSQRMVALVNTLLDISRIELGTFQIESQPTDVVALAQGVLDEQKPSIEKKKLIVTTDFSKNTPLFLTDPKLLCMVFQNLLDNAVEYTPPGGRIEFTISLYEKRSIAIKVSDTGYGIPKSQQDQIFTKFFRADNVRDKDTDGTGLGLYIVKSVVESFGGTIRFESEENKGTTFYVMLPLDTVKKKEDSK